MPHDPPVGHTDFFVTETSLKIYYNYVNNIFIKRYVRGADPVIKLMDEDGDVMETLAIDKWNTDSVEEFLQTYLILPGEENEKSENEI